MKNFLCRLGFGIPEEGICDLPPVTEEEEEEEIVFEPDYELEIRVATLETRVGVLESGLSSVEEIQIKVRAANDN
jgi:hypothetical protein